MSAPLPARELMALVAAAVAKLADDPSVDALARALLAVRDLGGRVFALGNGGGAAIASHAANDLAKIAGIEAYAPWDNAAEVSARANDDGWGTALAGYLDARRLSFRDALLFFSVGGGDPDKNVSTNLARAADLAVERRAPILAVTGDRGGYLASRAAVAVRLPSSSTPIVEGLQSVVLHCVVNHPCLRSERS